MRIIAATNKRLKEEVRKGRFREDLYYRSNVFTISLLPLRKRKDDIPLLADYFMRSLSKSMGKRILRIDDEVRERFMNYEWPGNVRELQNVLEMMINIAHIDRLTVDLLPPEIGDARSAKNAEGDVESVESMERELILRLLKSSLTKREISKKLGISRSTLYRKIEKYEAECGGRMVH